MSRVMLDDILREKLKNLAEPLDLCDESGRVVARVVLMDDPALRQGLEPQITREEMRRRKQNKDKTYTTDEVLDRLRKL